MDKAAMEHENGVRVILYSVVPQAYQLLDTWAKRNHHTVALVVTTPGPAASRNTMYREIVALVPPGQDVLVTTGMRRIAPLIAALAPDLLVSFMFPLRIPPEVTAIPWRGAVNLHPSPLPRYRGPNPERMIYDGEPILAATLHRTEPGFDTGAILSCHTRPLPADLSAESILAVWAETMMAALDEGARRALAGEPGAPQDDTHASYAAPFTDEELWLDWNAPSTTIQRHTAALNVLGVTRARTRLDGTAYAVQWVTPLADMAASGTPGQVLDRAGEGFTIRTADGAMRVIAAPL